MPANLVVVWRARGPFPNDDQTTKSLSAFWPRTPSGPKVGRAWAFKERVRHFREYTYLTATQGFFARWFWGATRLKTVAQVTWWIRRHLPNVLTDHRHRLTNAGSRP